MLDLAGQNQERRVFCEVDELREARKPYQSFLEHQNKRKKGELVKEQEQQSLEEYDI